jgi:hypothetical protein
VTTRPTLAQLIELTREELGTTFPGLAKRAADAGHIVLPKTLHHLATTTPTRLPENRTLHAIAAALGVEPAVVACAAMTTLGWDLRPVTEDDTTMVVTLPGATPEQRMQVLTAVDNLITTVWSARTTESA